jgi:hypothetical protein
LNFEYNAHFIEGSASTAPTKLVVIQHRRAILLRQWQPGRADLVHLHAVPVFSN